jgi:hypothetical protein
MPTIPDDPIRPRPRQSSEPARSRIRGAWPLLLLGLLLALVGWRASHGDDTGTPARMRGGAAGVERRIGDARLEVPRGWVELDRADDHATWGEPDRMHTVTLASTEASTLPLPGIVAALARRSEAELPGARLVEPPRAIDLVEPAPRDDSAMLARFRVDDGPSRLDVAQVWRRDTRAGLDVVATWTSGDGRWPISPRAAIPHAAASR